ncbi:MAG TPA: FAD-dependent oxidoreductase [Pseudonocardiaceae bacterium]|jgi:3-phenylpropionate/trans-cinnamate dioxygenase ferredoxin reductase subunit|nr:FAD-dependent oxidoreductase [Pseudonocardiaceae bacterium]
MTTESFVIIGAGLAGAKAAEALREQGFTGPLTLVGEERHLPYERPPLSKEYLAGKAERDSFVVHPQEWYAEQNIDLRLGVTASALDPAAHQVTLSDGSTLEYAKLLLATGSAPRTLPVPGAGADGVHYLRRVEDADRIKEMLGAGGRLVVIGAGWIGLEVTAAARAANLEVAVVESLDLPLLRVLGKEVAQVFADLHTEHGVSFHYGAQVSEIVVTEGKASGVKLADGTELAADAVLVGVGAAPKVSLAQEAGIEVDNGVLVDAGLRTRDPDVFAVGDIANAAHPVLDRRVRVEHWANALNQPAVAAAGMLGKDAEFANLPYFFTDQYDLGMEYVGYAEPGEYDRVVFRGDVGKREFIAFWLRDNRVLAGMNVNVWDVGDPIKALIRDKKQVDPGRLGNTEVPLEEV